MSTARAALRLVDEGTHRREVALGLARGIVEDDRSSADELAIAVSILRRCGCDAEAAAAAGLAVARGVELPGEAPVRRRRWGRVRGPFSRAA